VANADVAVANALRVALLVDFATAGSQRHAVVAHGFRRDQIN